MARVLYPSSLTSRLWRPAEVRHESRRFRTCEIGIRLALGAQKRELRWMFVRLALALTGIGIVVGVGAAVAVAQLMRTLLFDVSPLDPLSFAVVPLILALGGGARKLSAGLSDRRYQSGRRSEN